MSNMSKGNIGAIGIDGIDAKVSMTYLPTNKTILMLPLQGEETPTASDQMLITGQSTYSLDNMFKHFYERDEEGRLIKHPDGKIKSRLKVKADLDTTDVQNPKALGVEVEFRNLKDFEPDSIQENVPLLRSMRDEQETLRKFLQLLQRYNEETDTREDTMFGRMLKDAEKRRGLADFFRSVVAQIDEAEAA